jgi:hypothetical protein
MDRKLSRMILSRIGKFCSGILSATADEYRKKFIPEVMAGVVKAGTLVAAEIARATQKEGETTRGAWKSIRNHLGSKLWDKREEAINREFSRQQARWVEPRTVIVVDLSDLSKKYARKMQHLGWVRDASESSRRKAEVVERGYWLFESCTFGWDERTPIPLVNFVYSLEEGRFASENEVLEYGVREIHRATKGQGVITMDRRGDASFVLELLESLSMGFCVRLQKSRIVQDEEGRDVGTVAEVARRLVPQGRLRLKRRKGGRTLKIEVEYRYCRVYLGALKRPVYLVAAKGNFERADKSDTEGWWYLLTTEPVLTPADAERVLRWYRLRWKAEEAIEFLKRELGLERVRLLNFRAIRRLVQIAFWVMALLVEVMAGLATSTLRKLYQLGQVLRAVAADFLLYRIRRALAVFLRNPVYMRKLESICGSI